MHARSRSFAAVFGAVTALIGAVPGAFAHTGHEGGFSFFEGALHPLGGADHLAAMIAVGLWAAMAGGRRIWVWPIAFVASMLAGGAIGRLGIVVPMVEPAIAASVIVLGLLVAAGVTMPILPGAILIGSFALFHGYAHALEAPASDWLGYAAGFCLSTMLLHIVGLGLAKAMQRSAGLFPVRVAGAATVAAGIVFMAR